MKKALVLFMVWIILLLQGKAIVAEEIDKYVSIDGICIGDVYGKVIQTLKDNGAPFWYSEDEDGSIVLDTYLDIWGYQDDSARLIFDKHQRLVSIQMGWIDADGLLEIYSAFSSRLGVAEVLDIPYVDCDTDECSYIEYTIPVYIRWKEKNMIYELSLNIRPYTSVSSNLWNGTQIKADYSPMFSFDVLICSLAYYAEYYE